MEETNVKKKTKFKTILDDLFKYPLRLMTHPIAGYEEFEGKVYVAIVYLVLMIFAVILSTVATGFLVNPVKGKDYNLFFTISKVVFPVLLGTIANWCITALFEGKGTIKNIFLVICYSFFPFVWLSIIATIASNFVVANEVTYITFLNSAGIVLMGYMIFFGFKGVHEFSLLKNIIMILFTIVAIAIILFIALLFLSFIQQIIQWIASIVQEIKLRYF